MEFLLKLSRAIDWVNDRVGRGVMWLVLAAVLVSSVNAVVRKAFNIGSNAYLELQWYLFSAVFLLGAGYTFLRNAHVRIDFISSHLTARARNWIDIIGIIVFLGPLCVLLIYLSWPLFVGAVRSGEMSSNAGGLIRWPVYALLPAGMAFLLAQAASELIKRFAFLSGKGPDALAHVEHNDSVSPAVAADVNNNKAESK